jgi:glycosyltransferase involved in cell wall biosynthesis
MRIALVVPGGVDRSEEFRVIPALLALIRRLSRHAEVHVFALHQEEKAAQWMLGAAIIHNVGRPYTKMRAVRDICRVHRSMPFKVIQAIWSGACGLVAVSTAKILGIPSCIHVAGGELVRMPKIGYGGMLTWRGRLREPLVLRLARAVTAASAPVLDSLLALGLEAQRIPLGVDLDTWPRRDPVARDRGRAVRLIHVASLNRVKDQVTLLRALVALEQSGHEFEMDVVGEDTLHGEVMRVAENWGLSARVRFHGFLTRQQLRPLMEAADLMVHSSCHEAGPLVLLEAAVAGIPTVGTAVGHLAEWAPQAALTVSVGDWAALANVIRRVTDDDALRMSLAVNASRLAVREDADYTADRFLTLYRSLV